MQKTYGMCSKNSNSMLSDNPDSGFYEAETSRTIDTNGGNPCCNQGGMIVAAFIGKASANAASIGYSETVSPTLETSNPPVTMRIRSGCEGGGKGALLQIDKSGTLATGNDQYLFCPVENPVIAFSGGASPKSDIAHSEKISPTLRGGPGSTMTPHVCEAKICGINGNIAGTLDANYGKGPGMRGGIEREIVLCAATGQSNTEIQENLSPTLNCACEQPIVYKSEIEILNDQGGDSMSVEKNGHAPTLRHSTHGHLPVICVASGHTNAEICENHCPTIIASAHKDAPYIVKQQEGEQAYGFDLQQITSKTNRSSLKPVQPSLCAAGNPHVVHPEKTGTLTASAAGLNRPGGQGSETDLCVAYCLQGNMIGRTDENGPQGNGVNEEISFTLNTTDRHAVAAAPINPNDRLCGTICAKTAAPNGIGNGADLCILEKSAHHFELRGFGDYAESEISKTILSRDNPAACDVVAVDCRNTKEVGQQSGTLQAKTTPGYSLNYQNPVRIGYTVRRLTPTECERLQGFPDGWTAYEDTGKEISDSKRYQMLGNSVAIPCVAHIMRGVAEEMRKEK
jgi:DNA (cytosine-5)-methyltransferase 1